ncbi:MAG: FMN-binding protein [Spirochaetaceae bacterium]|jgi:uncharacterized protein with FMN-binding domain|nr:FMN-binding protein [Spirochaetaceae bacterium]
MKQRVKTALLLAAALSWLAGCAALGVKAGSAAGTGGGLYEGAAEGFRGPLRVRVRIDSGVIGGIEILEHREDEAIGGAAMAELLDLVLEYNSANLDAVSGATESSEGFLAAVEDALEAARNDSGIPGSTW